MKKTLLLAIAFMAVPMAASAATGIIGECSDCHTMHDSEQGRAVTKVGTSATVTPTPIANLLRMDCIACHADPTAGAATVTMAGGSIIPQVNHTSDANLAGGNFRYSTASDRHGHNVIDIDAADGSNAGAGTIGGTYNAPPGKYRASTHGSRFSPTTPFSAFTCAGARGCHGTRAQYMSASSGDWDNNNATANTWGGVLRTGIAAITGAHHASFDGLKTDVGYTTEQMLHDGAGKVAQGYRFIPGLKGKGNLDPANRWKNASSTSHNEYYGNPAPVVINGCESCHTDEGVSAQHMDTLTSMRVPNNTMSGFCATCHGMFHSVGTADSAANNGVSGAFLRHPSDYVLPAGTTEYAAYTTYDITAPVARPDLAALPAADVVRPGTDMVMCLSCHMAHASANDYMLRFDYNGNAAGAGDMSAGAWGDIATAQGKGGCLACHTTKGVLPENR